MKTNLLSFIALVIIGLSANAQPTQLWGTASSGGSTGAGTIFTANADGSNLHTVYNFVNATGQQPEGGMVLANNGKFYGVTWEGGYGDSCVVYSYNPSTGIYTLIYNLYQNTTQGWDAWSGMTKAKDGMLYGLCGLGGTNGDGVIFRVDPTTDNYQDIHNFNDATEGGNPYGSLMQFSDGKLYGMTSSGGANSDGTIFSFDPSNNTFTNVYSFTTASGTEAMYGKLMEATDRKLYGMTQSGGSNNAGVLFSFDPSTGIYTNLYVFDNIQGGQPKGSLMQATDGNLYGMTSAGGSNSDGVLFSFNINTGVYSDLLDFNGTNGARPQRSLTQGSTGKLFGTTNSGGTNGDGVAFSYDIATSTYTKLIDFNPTTTGSSPDCEIVEAPTGLETGVATINGTGTMSIFPIPATNTITILNSKDEETLQLVDVLGKELAVIKTPSFGKTTLDISNFPSVFFIKTENGETQKIIRQ